MRSDFFSRGFEYVKGLTGSGSVSRSDSGSKSQSDEVKKSNDSVKDQGKGSLKPISPEAQFLENRRVITATVLKATEGFSSAEIKVIRSVFASMGKTPSGLSNVGPQKIRLDSIQFLLKSVSDKCKKIDLLVKAHISKVKPNAKAEALDLIAELHERIGNVYHELGGKENAGNYPVFAKELEDATEFAAGAEKFLGFDNQHEIDLWMKNNKEE